MISLKESSDNVGSDNWATTTSTFAGDSTVNEKFHMILMNFLPSEFLVM